MSRVAFVTGATGGLGRAIAAALAADGCAVALADLPGRAADLESFAADLPDAIGVPVDVRQPETLHAATEATLDRFGSLDVMVCNAGVNVRRPSLEVTEADWDTVVDVNLRGVFFSAQAGARQMVTQGHGGKIVCIASIMGLVARANAAAYCASKAGVVNLTRVLAIEWASYNIQVNSVAPTFVHTPLTEGLFSDPSVLEMVQRATPNGRLATPQEIADAVVFLASRRADMITGTTLPVDGGWTAW
jgi:NAD(P)-dependent dehydrogenase (short-subunit alcohol dehydrogenase family)